MTDVPARGAAGIRAFSIIEIVIALALAAIFAAVAVPFAGGWLSERRLRGEVLRLQSAVTEARIEALTTGTVREIVVLSPKQSGKHKLPPEARPFLPDAAFEWIVGDGKPGRIRISSRGLVEPVPVKVSQGGAWISFQFDLLTGMPHDEQSSFY